MDWVFLFSVVVACVFFWTLDWFQKALNDDQFWNDGFFGAELEDEDQDKKSK